MRWKKTLFFLLVTMVWSANTIAATPILRHNLPYKNFIATLGLGLGVHDADEIKRTYAADVYGFGLSHMGVELGITRVLSQGWDVTGNIAVGGMSYGKLFASETRKQGLSGFGLETAILFRYLYALSQEWGLGGQLGFGYAINKPDQKVIDIIGITKPLQLRAGAAIRYTPIDSLNLYASVSYTLKNIGKSNAKATGLAKTLFHGSNAHGLEIPVGIHWQMDEYLGFFAEVTTVFADFRAKNAGYEENFFLGMSLASSL